MRVAVWLLVVEFIGILAPLVLLTGRPFSGPHHAPTLEGQYVLKDIILVAAGMAIAAGTFRGGRLIRDEPGVPDTPPAPTAKPADDHDARLAAATVADIALEQSAFCRWSGSRSSPPTAFQQHALSVECERHGAVNASLRSAPCSTSFRWTSPGARSRGAAPACTASAAATPAAWPVASAVGVTR
jgi:hypothetical protein